MEISTKRNEDESFDELDVPFLKRQRSETDHNFFSNEEKSIIKEQLEQKLGKEEISKRTGAGSSSVYYIETRKAIELSNKIFGFDSWSTDLKKVEVDYLDEDKDGRVTCGVSAVVRMSIKGGSYHDDVGYGISENIRGKGPALEKAKKEAVSDAIKRCARQFGNHLGNSVYDKEHLKEINRTILPPTQSQKQQTTIPVQNPPSQPLNSQHQLSPTSYSIQNTARINPHNLPMPNNQTNRNPLAMSQNQIQNNPLLFQRN